MSQSITFIIPTIGRNTLERAIQSIENQTNNEWKIIVIFDGIKSTLKNSNSNSKIRVLEIEKKGIDKNSAGNVRNHGMKYADTEWIAFLDDDDVISPDYVETFYKEIQDYPFVDVLIFRMLRDDVIIPKLKTDNFYQGDVGISFVINKKILNNVKFIPSGVEDYNFLNEARKQKFVIMISPYVKYFVREIKDVSNNNFIGERIFINNLKEGFMENNNTFNYIKFVIIFSILFFLYFFFLNYKRFYKFIKSIMK
jgi:glycosyltransferase involved in cell wall biosynthesis